jgi:hypothetical protein
MSDDRFFNEDPLCKYIIVKYYHYLPNWLNSFPITVLAPLLHAGSTFAMDDCNGLEHERFSEFSDNPCDHSYFDPDFIQSLFESDFDKWTH